MEFTRRKLKTPKSLGEILKTVRQKKKITLDQAEEEIKVRSRYLEALEEGRFEILPEPVYAVGFLVKYAEFLGLNPKAMLDKFNAERGTNFGYNSKIMVERRIREPLFSITPRFFIIAGIILGLLLILGYIAFSVRSLTSPPNLVISGPVANQTITEDNVEIVGKTDEGATVSINGQNIFVDDLGNFHQIVKLRQGLNSFEICSTNQLKKESIKTINVVADLGDQAAAESEGIESSSPLPQASPDETLSASPTPTPTKTSAKTEAKKTTPSPTASSKKSPSPKPTEN